MKRKTIQHTANGSRPTWFITSLSIKSAIICTFILAGIQGSLQAQDTLYTRPSWRFGVAAGANFNFFSGSTQELNANFTSPAAFQDGYGVGLFAAPVIEFYRPNTRFGLILQAGIDSRKGSFQRIVTPCHCPADLLTNLNYITIEPSLRYAPFKSNFYLYGGPRFAFNWLKSFTYKQQINPAYPEQVAKPDVKSDFSHINKNLISMQIGMGYDIPLSSNRSRTQVILAPFVSFQPYYGQKPRSIETWNLTTLRVGAAIKFGRGHKIPTPVEAIAEVITPEVQFKVNSPSNIPTERRVRETFPLRNYIFFDLGSTEIPNRYVLLKKNQVQEFREDQLEVLTPKKLEGRSNREMTVYYNVINILGDRMIKNPSTTITLVGSSEKGPKDGLEMAGSVKIYLVTIFGIDASRISTEGRDKPKLPSERPGGTLELVLLREGDRRVSIESSSPEMLMEFQSGPDASLKPVEINVIQEAPIDSYVTFSAEGSNTAFSSWSIQIKDENGSIQTFGPYTQEQVSIPGKIILGNRLKGDYKITMIGLAKNGKTVKKESTAHIVLWTPPVNEQGLRYSVIFEFNDSKTIAVYRNYLEKVVAPKIPLGGTVIIHGHTDIIGSEINNQKLSLARANEVKNILKNSLSKAGREDVKFEVMGFGEDTSNAPFDNKLPEERFYNRTVIIDILP
jgi:outer membrane protein OmpA-like peptidoglycan-associated protein